MLGSVTSSTAVLLGGLAATAMGHGFVTDFKTDGKQNQGFRLSAPYFFSVMSCGCVNSPTMSSGRKHPRKKLGLGL